METIHPRDFADSTLGNHTVKDRHEHSWHMMSGEMRHLAQALIGQEVIAELDVQTGFTCRVIVRGWTTTGGGYNTPSLVVEHIDDSTGLPVGRTIAYRLASVGSIVYLGSEIMQAPSSVAKRSIQEERTKAIEMVREANPHLNYGKWTASPLFDRDSVSVRYEPQREGAGSPTYVHVNVNVPLRPQAGV